MYIKYINIAEVKMCYFSLFLSRSSEQHKPDESGISSEEGWLPWPAFSQLADIASLFQELETKLDAETSEHEHETTRLGEDKEGEPGGEREDGDRGKGGEREEEEEEEEDGVSAASLPQIFPSELVVIHVGPPGTQPNLARYDRGASAVYSRSSNQLFLTSRSRANTKLVTPKDSRVPRSAEVTVVLPKDDGGERRWTRAGTRAICSTRDWGVHYLEESDETTSNSSSDDRDCGMYEPELGRKKKRRKQLAQTAGRGGSSKKRRERVGIGMLITSTEEEEEEEEVEVENWRQGGSGGMAEEVGMEYEVEGGLESPTFTFPSTGSTVQGQVLLESPSHCGHMSSTSLSGIYTVYEDLKLHQPTEKQSMEPVTKKRDSQGVVADTTCSNGGGGRGNRQRVSVKPCAVSVTSLPRHMVDKHLAYVRNQSTSDGPARLRDSTSPESSSSSSSSDSLSMLSRPSMSQSQPRGSHPSPSARLTPRRLGDGKTPVARRSLPFSKPPRTLNLTPTTSKKSLEATAASASPNARGLPVGWSPDEDFEGKPSPFFTVSPVVEHKAREARKEKAGGNDGIKSSQTSGESLGKGSLVRVSEGGLSQSRSGEKAAAVAGKEGSSKQSVSPFKTTPTKTGQSTSSGRENSVDSDLGEERRIVRSAM